MIKSFLYNSQGKDQEIEIGKILPKLSAQKLLWVDVVGTTDDNSRVSELFSLSPAIWRNADRDRRYGKVENYGDYFHLPLVALLPLKNAVERLLLPETVHFNVVVGKLWLLTIHDKELPFLVQFRDQDRADTLIGKLSSAALASSLLDWHLNAFLDAVESVEFFCDKIDLKILGDRRVHRTALQELGTARRYVSELGRLLAAQRQIFYGISRADVQLMVDEKAAPHFEKLEHRFERVVDAVENGRNLVKGSFDLYSASLAEATDRLVRRLTFFGAMLGIVGAVAGIFGMNFDTRFAHLGELGFWAVIAALGILVLVSALVSIWRKWL